MPLAGERQIRALDADITVPWIPWISRVNLDRRYNLGGELIHPSLLNHNLWDVKTLHLTRGLWMSKLNPSESSPRDLAMAKVI